MEIEPAVKGVTHEWRFDLRILRAAQFIQHVLVLPELEETYREAAALSRIWQDIQARHPRWDASLTAVFYSRNGMPAKSKLEPGERLLKKDEIMTVFPKELPQYYLELLGQRRLGSHRS